MLNGQAKNIILTPERRIKYSAFKNNYGFSRRKKIRLLKRLNIKLAHL